MRVVASSDWELFTVNDGFDDLNEFSILNVFKNASNTILLNSIDSNWSNEMRNYKNINE